VTPSRLLIGLVLVGLGVLFLFDQAGALDAGEVIGDWWPVVIIALGLFQLGEHPRSPVVPLIVAGVGIILLLTQLDVVGDDVWRFVWPVALVLIGLAIVLRRPGRDVPRGAGEDVVRMSALFSGNDVVSTSRRFRGGSVSAIFGGATLDLRQAQLDPKGAMLAVTAVFGGVEILVPHGWRVETTGMPIFGGYDNKVEPPPADAEAPTLKVDATAIFGGADIKHEKG
jgi:cell wall-active antibiotic response 4TMS protein YvqF